MPAADGMAHRCSRLRSGWRRSRSRTIQLCANGCATRSSSLSASRSSCWRCRPRHAAPPVASERAALSVSATASNVVAALMTIRRNAQFSCDGLLCGAEGQVRRRLPAPRRPGLPRASSSHLLAPHTQSHAEHAFTHTRARARARTRSHTLARTQTRAPVHTHACAHARTFVLTHTDACTHPAHAQPDAHGRRSNDEIAVCKKRIEG